MSSGRPPCPSPPGARWCSLYPIAGGFRHNNDDSRPRGPSGSARGKWNDWEDTCWTDA